VKGTHGCSEKRDICEKGTLRNNPPWAKVSRCRDKVLQGLHKRHASDGSVESNMEMAIGQRHRYANVINKTHNGNVLRCDFNDPREGKLDHFSCLESLKKHKRRLRTKHQYSMEKPQEKYSMP
jgi:hypothetical protein